MKALKNIDLKGLIQNTKLCHEVDVDVNCLKHGLVKYKGFALKSATVHQCPECLSEEKYKEKRMEHYTSMVKASGIPFDLEQCTIKGFITDSDNDRNNINICKEWLHKFITNNMRYGFIATGNVGSGKSHILVAIGKQAILNNKSFEYITQEKLLAKIASTWKDSLVSQEDLFRRWENLDLLCIDECAVKSMTEKMFGLFNSLIDDRYNNRKPTIIASNLNLKDLEKSLGTRVVSRLGATMYFKGIDRRGKAF